MDFAKARAEDYSGLADSLDRHFPVIDGLIHNAAQLGTLCPVEYYPDNDWETLINVNLNAVFHLTKAAMPSLKRSEDARLLFISSSVGRKGRAYWGGYGVSKFALEGLMQTLADELSSTSNIRVNSLNPGGTRTAMRQAAYPAEDPHSQPEAESLMPVYLYLLGPEAAHIHGQALDARDFDPSTLNTVEGT
jgi:NAD(P)-dependent dehydrogenase (short-subunit alcohol dehydrogenase family)